MMYLDLISDKKKPSALLTGSRYVNPTKLMLTLCSSSNDLVRNVRGAIGTLGFHMVSELTSLRCFRVQTIVAMSG